MCCLSPIIQVYPDHTECVKCGTVQYNFKPYKKRSVDFYEGIKERVTYPSISRNHLGTCCNCKRPKLYLNGKMCSTCNKSINGLDKKSAKAKQILLKTAKRLNGSNL